MRYAKFVVDWGSRMVVFRYCAFPRIWYISDNIELNL